MIGLKNMTKTKVIIIMVVLIASMYLIPNLGSLIIGLAIWGFIILFVWGLFASAPSLHSGYADDSARRNQEESDIYCHMEEENRINEENRYEQEVADRTAQAATDRM